MDLTNQRTELSVTNTATAMNKRPNWYLKWWRKSIGIDVYSQKYRGYCHQ